MKIIHCLNFYLPDHIAGTEVYVAALSKGLQNIGITCKVLVPNFSSAKNERYFYEDVEVIKYAQPSLPDRDMLQGKKAPDGLDNFIEILKAERPDVVHFHEMNSSNGISLFHIKAARQMHIKTVMTFHLAGYSCMTDNLMYKDEYYCDGIIRIKRCSQCYLHVKKSPAAAALLTTPSMFLYKAGVNSLGLNAKIGTAFGTPFIVEKLRERLFETAEVCDRLVLLTDWYKNILEQNGLPGKKLRVIKQGLVAVKKYAFVEKEKKPCMLKLIFIGRISPFKGLEILIRALKEVNKEVQLDIYGKVGDKEYAEKCRLLTEGMQNIQWKGILSPDKVVSTMEDYDVLCLPSAFSEMSPLVIQEAFAAGIPVLASDVYGNAEQVKDNYNGWLFRFKDKNDLAVKIQMLLNEPGLIVAAGKNIPRVKSFGQVAEAYADLYGKILAGEN